VVQANFSSYAGVIEVAIQMWLMQRSKTLYEKQAKAKRLGGVDEVVEHLPSKYRALGSNSNTVKNKTK
jgi:hypothetical protein